MLEVSGGGSGSDKWIRIRIQEALKHTDPDHGSGSATLVSDLVWFSFRTFVFFAHEHLKFTCLSLHYTLVQCTSHWGEIGGRLGDCLYYAVQLMISL